MSADADPETVYRSSSTRRSGRSLHADEDCPHLQHAEDYVAKPLAVFPPDEPRCTDCFGDGDMEERVTAAGRHSGQAPWTCPLCGADLTAAQRPGHLEGHP